MKKNWLIGIALIFIIGNLFLVSASALESWVLIPNEHGDKSFSGSKGDTLHYRYTFEPYSYITTYVFSKAQYDDPETSFSDAIWTGRNSQNSKGEYKGSFTIPSTGTWWVIFRNSLSLGQLTVLTLVYWNVEGDDDNAIPSFNILILIGISTVVCGLLIRRKYKF